MALVRINNESLLIEFCHFSDKSPAIPYFFRQIPRDPLTPVYQLADEKARDESVASPCNSRMFTNQPHADRPLLDRFIFRYKVLRVRRGLLGPPASTNKLHMMSRFDGGRILTEESAPLSFRKAKWRRLAPGGYALPVECNGVSSAESH